MCRARGQGIGPGLPCWGVLAPRQRQSGSIQGPKSFCCVSITSQNQRIVGLKSQKGSRKEMCYSDLILYMGKLRSE